ncbi:hypothetical protein [Saccharothrix variisporea]|uniref:Uncharacterized protein n=1 Tax=Saccharothrix variisporea TaxID=543527 RepID=A0A495XD73_9PSEU|nr:hypothetical protein [Saccharothrix variisporea]RKT71609.1 hypothetical protein DFJ66_4902 [Saccharothrix variisporea]
MRPPRTSTTARTGRVLGLALALAATLGVTGLATTGPDITPVASAKDAKGLERVKTSTRYDQVHWQKVPGVGGTTCLKTRIQGTIQYEYDWVKLAPSKAVPVLRSATIVAPKVTVSAWNGCAGAARKPVKLSGTSFEQRWLNADRCSASGLALSAGGPPWAVTVGTTINCGRSETLSRRSDFARTDNDFQESNNDVRIAIQDSAMKTKGTTKTGQWKCTRVEVGGRVVKSNKNDNFGHTFYPCIHLPKFRWYE